MEGDQHQRCPTKLRKQQAYYNTKNTADVIKEGRPCGEPRGIQRPPLPLMNFNDNIRKIMASIASMPYALYPTPNVAVLMKQVLCCRLALRPWLHRLRGASHPQPLPCTTNLLNDELRWYCMIGFDATSLKSFALAINTHFHTEYIIL